MFAQADWLRCVAFVAAPQALPRKKKKKKKKVPGYQIGTWTLPLPTRLLTRESLVVELVLSRGGAMQGVCSCCPARFLPLLPTR